MGTGKKQHRGLSARNQAVFSEFACRIRMLHHDSQKRSLISSGLAAFRGSYWRGLRCCVFPSLGKARQVERFVGLLGELGIAPNQIRVMFFCPPDSPVVKKWKERLPFLSEVLIVYRRPPSAASKRILKSIGVDVVFPAGRSVKAMEGFLLFLRFAARIEARGSAPARS